MSKLLAGRNGSSPACLRLALSRHVDRRVQLARNGEIDSTGEKRNRDRGHQLGSLLQCYLPGEVHVADLVRRISQFFTQFFADLITDGYIVAGRATDGTSQGRGAESS